jgi:hypothetical protein
VIDLLVSLARKGFADGDDALIRNNNIGLQKTQAVYIDTGHIFRAQNLDVLERMRYEFQVRLTQGTPNVKIPFPCFCRERALRT